MDTTSSRLGAHVRPAAGRLRRFALIVSGVALAWAPAARAQDAGDASSSDRGWNYPSKGPTREQSRAAGGDEHWWEHGPWSVAASFGPAWFTGDGVSGNTDFAAEARLAPDVSHHLYLLGPYSFLDVATKVGDPPTASCR